MTAHRQAPNKQLISPLETGNVLIYEIFLRPEEAAARRKNSPKDPFNREKTGRNRGGTSLHINIDHRGNFI